MSETADPRQWGWQGFYGPMANAAATIGPVFGDPRVGARVPLPAEGQPATPMPVDVGGAEGMYAVMTRANARVPTPPGMKQADPAIVGRMVRA